MIKLVIVPRLTIKWREFIYTHPSYSLALDGYVYGKSRDNFNSNSGHPPQANINHHEEVDRMSTRSTTAQVNMFIKQGGLDRFKINGEVNLEIYINDPDQDVCTSVWQLRNHDRIEGHKSEPLINRLIYAEDMLDTTAGSYPFDPNCEMMRGLAWIYEPYNVTRTSGHLYKMNGSEMESVVDAVCARIDKYSLGQGKTVAIDARYNTIFRQGDFAVVEEIGPQARSKIFWDGIKSCLIVKSNEPDNRHTYVVCKSNRYINLPLDKLFNDLNEMESIAKDNIDRWGGSDIVGGSPRLRGSSLSIEQILSYIRSKYLCQI